MASRSLFVRLSRLSLSSYGRQQTRCCPFPLDRASGFNSKSSLVRSFSNRGKDGVDDFEPAPPVEDSQISNTTENDDPFGVSYADGAGLGPEAAYPPIFERDSTTGKLTGAIKKELTEEEKKILEGNLVEDEKRLMRHLEQHWNDSGVDDTGVPVELNKLGERIRRSKRALNVLGRSPRAVQKDSDAENDEPLGGEIAKDLSPSEFKSFQAFVENRFNKTIDEDDISVSTSSASTKNVEVDPDSEELALKWLSARAQRQMDDSLDDNPYSDLMPGDFSPTRLVNRKRAKQIPVKVLHHNNIPLLQKFLTPTGQIKHRVQSRLGARDQRRVAKLIKRARSMGLMPYLGQQKVETHGWIHETDLNEDREWEQELKSRGLTIKQETDQPNTT